MEIVKTLIKSWLILLIIGLSQAGYAVTVDKIIAFGDSLSDNGNLYAFTKRAHKVFRTPIIPADPPYYKGRFSNGENWLDILSKNTGLPLLDHAYGGAWAESIKDSALIVPNIGTQVTFYLGENLGDFNKNRHLYVIWVGANDYLWGREDVEYASTNTVNSIKKQIERLIYHGAHQLLVLSLPDVSKTPEVIDKGPRIVDQVKVLVEEHNIKLAAMVKEVQEKNPKILIVYYDAKQAYDRLIENPAAYNIKNIDTPCYGGYFYLNRMSVNQDEILAAKKELKLDIMNNASLREAYLTSKLAMRGNDVCANPDEYLFWDHIHPTRVIHHMIATVAELELNAHNIKWEKK